MRKNRINQGVKKPLSRIGLSIKCSIMIFIILCLSGFISAVLMGVMKYLGVFSESTIHEGEVIPLTLLMSCIIIGTLISIKASHSMVKAVEEFIAATHKLANGDFTARLHLEHPLEFQVMSDNFNHMAKELASIEVLRTDFINNFSHEFKTPIVSIKGFAEILKRDDLTPEERAEYLDIVIEEASRLARLATNVLEVTKVEQQGILTNKQLFNLGEQIRQCVLLLDSKMSEKNIELDLNINDYKIQGNKEMMSQVWVNLLDNAIKFTENKGCISLDMQKDDSQITVQIKDTGRGISKEALPRIFDKFYQADASHATKGHGLGLAMVKKIVELHGGTIKCESQLTQGTIFTIVLPIE